VGKIEVAGSLERRQASKLRAGDKKLYKPVVTNDVTEAVSQIAIIRWKTSIKLTKSADWRPWMICATLSAMKACRA